MGMHAMNLNFADAVAQLWSTLGLAPPAADDLQSVTVGGHAVHVTEQPQNHMLMFTFIESRRQVNATMVNAHNAFGPDALSPIIGLDDTTQQWLVWNRQSIAHCDAETLAHQMEQVVQCAEQFCEEQPAPQAAAIHRGIANAPVHRLASEA